MGHRPLLGGPGKWSHEEGREHRKRRACAKKQADCSPANRNQEAWPQLVWVGEVLGFTQLCDTECQQDPRKQGFSQAHLTSAD